MKYLIVFLLFSLQLKFASGQESYDTSQVELKRFSIGLCISPNYTFRTTNSLKSVFRYTILESERYVRYIYNTKFDIADYNFGYGIIMSERITKRWNIEFGCMYQLLSYKTGVIDTTIVRQTAVDWIPPYDTLVNQNSFRFTYKNLSLPLNIQYKLKSFNNITINLGVGFVMNYLVKNEIEVNNFFDPSLPKVREIRSDGRNIYLFGLVKLKASYLLTKKMNIFIDPQFQYLLRSIKRTNYTQPYIYNKIHLYSYSVNIGVNLSF